MDGLPGSALTALTALAVLAGGAALALAAGALIVVHGIRHPRRATIGWALAKGYPADPGALGLRWEEVGDRAMPIWRITGRGSGAAPVLLLLHGWNRSRIDSLRRLEPLLDCCSVAYLPDLPGHGESEAATPVGAREHLALLAAMRDHMKEATARGVIIAGHSMGAVIGIRLATHVAGDIRAIVAWAPYDSAVQPIAARLAAQGLRVPGLAALAHTLLRLRTGREEPTAAMLGQLRRQADPPPLLMVLGEGDRVVAPAIVDSLFAGAPANWALVRSHGDHASLGCLGDESVEAQRAWLQGVLAARATRPQPVTA